MRLTDKMVQRSYLESLNLSMRDVNGASARIAAKRKYLKASENPTDAFKAMQVRKNLSKTEVYINNLSEAEALLSQYETAISNINEIVKEAQAQVSQGITGTGDETVKRTVAGTLRSFQASILAAANAKFAGDYIFGGDNVGDVPFTVSPGGELLYKGQSVDTGVFGEETRYIDIGLGLSYGPDGEFDKSSALNIANSGIALLGAGQDPEGISNNLYTLLGEIADKIEHNDLEDIQSYADKLNQKADDIRLQYVSVGEKNNLISYFVERHEAEMIHAQNRQVDLEGIDYAKSIVEFEEMQLAYNACLQIGTKILLPSLLDFLR